MSRWISIILLVSIPINFALALRRVTGVVNDQDGLPIAGVNITINGRYGGCISDDSGLFSCDLDLTASSYLTFTHVAYQPVMLKAANEGSLEVVMQQTIYPLQGITVTDDRAAFGKTPIAFTDFTTTDIKRDYMIGEFPLLLESTPNLYAYADAGGGLGYSYLKIRGFDDKRVSVYINGIPLNDPEDQATYFVDLPDFASSVKDIQVQRGIGNSLYGDASFGGSVNIVSAGLEQPRKITLSTGYGGFWENGDFVGDMQKQSVEYRSGLIDGRWNFSGRYSRQLSEGYRENSWYDGWSYYFSMSRLDPRVSTTVNLYGGPMKMHLAYYGISRGQLLEDRRFNPLAYDNETDNFNQPHYELHNTIKLNDKLTLNNTLYHIHGNGFYEQYKEKRWFADYNLPPSAITSENGDTLEVITEGDLVRQQLVNKNQWGWTPNLEFKQDRGQLTLGGAFYYFESKHWGQVVWAEGLTNQVSPRHRYYEYLGKKFFASLYASQNYQLTDRLNLMANLQLRRQTYNFDQTRMGAFQGYSYDVDWTFVSPRAGIVYTVDENANLHFNYSFSSRAPADYEIYDAGDPYALPSLQIKAVKFAADNDSTIIFGDPTAKAEHVHNFELGFDYREERQSQSINFYWMDFRDEIVPYGGINPDLGLPITTNVKRSVHAGVELTAMRKFGKPFKLGGNFSYSYNKIRDFTISEAVYDNDTDYNYLENREFSYDNKTISGFPQYIGNLTGEYLHNRFHLTYRGRFIGRIYVENGNDRELSIDPYFTSSASAEVTLGRVVNLGSLSLAVRVDNLFDEKYEAAGYGGVTRFRDVPDQTWAEYIPAAGRSFFLTLLLELK